MTALFPGLVARQELINFCRARVAEMQKESDQYLDMLNKVGDKLSSDDAMALNDAHYKNLGEQMGYRRITDWAQQNCVEGSEEIDGADLENILATMQFFVEVENDSHLERKNG